ncbi:MAG: DUF362 domain-containing protein [Thermoplasmatales archaeon]|nr:MAG: DUF362 domain-containing protein [Thermoplasmatales archaeon]
MNLQYHRCKKNLISRMNNLKGIWFHIVGIACIIWFLIRVVPAPHRVRYPCQQMSITVALGYIVFWSVLFHGLLIWIRRVKWRTSAIIPTLSVIFIIIFSVTGMVFADNYFNEGNNTEQWDPILKEPIGTPLGANPGRVVWIWDPDSTESDLKGYWWKKENNNQSIIDQMFSSGIQGLAGVESVEDAWDILFKHFNQVHGNGEVGYQPGEKIAIKINLNNCWEALGYIRIDNDRDASPYVVKALLRQLINTVGVAQEDITIYDASRKMVNWFYKRVYYETYPAIPLVPEFPDINYVDKDGGASGRQKVEASTQKIYFADDTGLSKALPTCVVDAKYIINMPILKRHPIQQGITLSGKNFFGTWIGPVEDIHNYHTGAFTAGNPAPQTDLLAHEHIGGKTILFIGDGIYATKKDHCTITKFNMYPFNNDWTNSLFFSQDPVAIDSVMYDFLHSEGANPPEGSQNYLHQSAEPPTGVYDPENDGVYVSESLGVHEHWDTTLDIFSSERYSGPSDNGIDFVAYGEENAQPAVIITQPRENYLYLSGKEIIPLPITVIIGKIFVESRINGITEDVEKVEFYIDNEYQYTAFEGPYTWLWDKPNFFRHTLKVIAYYNDGDQLSENVIVWKFF